MTHIRFGFSISPGEALGVSQEVTQAEALGYDSDYSIWEGWQVRGWPVMTMLHGQVVVEGGQLLGRPTDGRFVKRKLQPAMLSAGGA